GGRLLHDLAHHADELIPAAVGAAHRAEHRITRSILGHPRLLGDEVDQPLHVLALDLRAHQMRLAATVAESALVEAEDTEPSIDQRGKRRRIGLPVAAPAVTFEDHRDLVVRAGVRRLVERVADRHRCRRARIRHALQTAFGDDGRRGRCRRGPHPQRNPGQHSNQCGTEPANVPHQAPRFVDRIRDSNDRTDAKGARKCTVSWVARADSPRRSVITATARAQSTHTGWHPCTQGVDMRVRTKWFGALAAVAAGIAASAIAVMPSASAQSAAAPDKLPVTVTNDSGRSEQVHLYVLGIKDGQLGYVDQAGDFSAWPPGSNPPSPAPDVSIPGPAAGESTTVNIPKGLSGRIYMSFGDELEFFLTPDGLVQPAPWNPSDPNHDILFDWSE